MNLLIVGANSVSGQEIAKHIKKTLNAHVIGTTSSQLPIPNVDKTILGIDLSYIDSVTRICESISEPIDFIIYIPARGKVGFPTKYSTKQMVIESFQYSVIPYIELSRRLTPKKTIVLSGFITMPPMLLCYGCMALTKIIMEELAFQFPDKFSVLRLGMFYSKSVRGIALATKKNMKSHIYPELDEMKKEWNNSGLSFDDFFYGKNWFFEKTIYQDFANNKMIPFRKTETSDIAKSIVSLLTVEPKPVLNVLGDWVWEDQSMILVPEVINNLRDFIKDELEQVLKKNNMLK